MMDDLQSPRVSSHPEFTLGHTVLLKGTVTFRISKCQKGVTVSKFPVIVKIYEVPSFAEDDHIITEVTSETTLSEAVSLKPCSLFCSSDELQEAL